MQRWSRNCFEIYIKEPRKQAGKHKALNKIKHTLGYKQTTETSDDN